MNPEPCYRACPADVHAAMKEDPERVRATCTFVGVQDSGLDILELYNCICRSTISIPGIGPTLYFND